MKQRVLELEDFHGHWTQALRERFNLKRLSLGLSLQDLSSHLHVNWSTIRKWENGSTEGCHPRHIGVVRSFLNGELDSRMQVSGDEVEELASCWHKLPASMHNCLERITMLYELCEGEPKLRQQLLEQLRGAANDAIAELVNLDGGSSGGDFKAL